MLFLLKARIHSENTANYAGCSIDSSASDPGLDAKQAPVFQCPECAFITSITVRAGCWFDGLQVFECSDGSSVRVNVGGSGSKGHPDNTRPPHTFTSASGFIGARVGQASFADNAGVTDEWPTTVSFRTADLKADPSSGARMCEEGTSAQARTVSCQFGRKVVGVQAASRQDYPGYIKTFDVVCGSTK